MTISNKLFTKTLLKPRLPPCHADSVGMVPLLLVAQAPILAKSFFVCSRMDSPYEKYHYYVTDDPKTLCPECKSKMSMKLSYVGSDVKDENLPSYACNGYVKGVVTYMIMDDLVVNPMSTISSMTLLNRLSIKDVSSLEEKVVHLGLGEGVALLKASLESKTVLTDVFLAKRKLVCKGNKRGGDSSKWKLEGGTDAYHCFVKTVHGIQHLFD
ncbi:hypothetical protein Ancab_015038 [Ancistrocladus abbreviatus]